MPESAAVVVTQAAEPIAKSTTKTILSLILFGIAFGYVEAAVVVYLRVLYEPYRASAGMPVGQLFPLLRVGQLGSYMRAGQAGTLLRLVEIELIREAATIVMLAVVAAATRLRWLPSFAIVFGAWDLTFYACLKRLIDWPASVFTWDVLFLLPVPWAAPVLAPCIVAASLVIGGILGLTRPVRKNRWTEVLLAAGALVIILSFTWDWRFYVAGGVPANFRWGMFGVGETLGIVAMWIALA